MSARVDAKMDRTTPSGFASNALAWNHLGEPRANHLGRVRLATWDECTGTVEVYLDHEDVPAYAAALLAEYVKVEAERKAGVS